ncbi:MAG: hypothetical protein U0228_39450 [Myxococcaceae bacterium]
MGLFDGLFKKKSGGDALESLKTKFDENPKDGKLAQDIAGQLKAKGDLPGAVEYAVKAAGAFRADGFLQKAIAALRMAEGWNHVTPELLRSLADVHLELKHKEDARGVLIKLRRLHFEKGNKAELPALDKELAELGPGR